ncbi:MAG: glutathione S-transferase family protein [Reinekea sp.]|jgi:glutathione S-transferase
MITLYQTAPAFGLLNASPFCMKLEAFLRWQNIPYTTTFALPDQGPSQQIPFIDYQGQKLGDSNAIIYQLIEDMNLDTGSQLDWSYGVAFQRVVEDHLYWIMVYFRWMDDEIWPALRETFFAIVPEPQREAIAEQAREYMKQKLHLQGISRLPEEMMKAAANADLKALSSHLSQQPFICGHEMSHFDLAVWAMLSQLISSSLVIQLTPLAQQYPVLQTYIDRVSEVISQGTKTL